MLVTAYGLRTFAPRHSARLLSAGSTKNISSRFSTKRASTALAEPSVSANKVVLSPLPKVYVYDHCPFCVRVRLALGLKGIKQDIVFLMNDDVATPTALVGKKIAPIFELPGVVSPMAESLDIVATVDSDPRFGKVGYFKPFSGRTDLKEWQDKMATPNRYLQRPRYMMTYLPEFATVDGKNAYVRNHPIAPHSKDEWQNNMSNKERWAVMEDIYQKSLTMIDSTNEALKELDTMIYSTEHCTEGGLSYDDIDLWSRLRSLTLVKGLVFPAKLKAWMDTLAEKGDLPLYWSIQC